MAQYFRCQNQLMNDEFGNQVAELTEQIKKLTAQSTTPQTVQEEIVRQPVFQEDVGDEAFGPEFNAASGYEADFIQPRQGNHPDRPRSPYRHAFRVERPRFEDGDGLLNNIKMSIPEVEGLHDPDLYLDWERKERHRHERYPPVDTWEEMKGLMRGQFIPVHYERELEKKLTRIKQGIRSMEEYHKELETTLNRVGKQETLNATIIQYIEGMNPDIACEVELNNFTSIEETVHYASIVERQLREGRRRSHHSSAPVRPSWNKAPPSRPAYTRPNQPSSTPQPGQNRARDIQCHKCQGWGHFQNQYLNRRVLFITKQNEIDRTSILKPLSPKAVAENQQRMQEKFKEERAKVAAAAAKLTAATVPLTVKTSPKAHVFSITKTTPKQLYIDSLAYGKTSGSAAKEDKIHSLLFSNKGVDKAINSVEFAQDKVLNLRTNSFQRGGGGNDEAMLGLEELNPEFPFKGPIAHIRAKQLQGYFQIDAMKD
ncbi:hypothetical protein C2S53_009952 [Perilla frutescens var. hirtella]|uniref:Retrotransposon gag domain-containing protein n=1 Tax=Perilla frutescens var. hirtella TaxID=608512 RepID=A0AAD4P629_PERFH|nr:hypothetical protein C2S53_009952 [Perilla frutescens var. hirtella]